MTRFPLKIRRRVLANSLAFTNGCAGKVKHPSKRHAIAARMSLIRAAQDRREWEDAVMLVPYKCNGHYHIGH